MHKAQTVVGGSSLVLPFHFERYLEDFFQIWKLQWENEEEGKDADGTIFVPKIKMMVLTSKEVCIIFQEEEEEEEEWLSEIGKCTFKIGLAELKGEVVYILWI